MPEKRILIVHPYDKTAAFLDEIKNHLQTKFQNDIQYFNVNLSNQSHEDCLKSIKNHPTNGFIIFLGHGRSDKLYGARGDDHLAIVSNDARDESPERFYYNEDFINQKNVNVFKDKKVFCLACKSNDKIAQYAIDGGAVTFIGFGDIPTSESEFVEREEEVSLDFVARMKTELSYIIKSGLSYALTLDLNADGLVNIIDFITRQRITDILFNQQNFQERNLLADYLYYLKRDIKIYGEKEVKLLG